MIACDLGKGTAPRTGRRFRVIAEVCLVVPTGRIEQAEDAHLIL